MKKLLSVLLILSLLLMIVPIVSASGLPSSCAEIKSGNPSAADGEYTISINGTSSGVYCHNMGRTPTEYLTLIQTGDTANFSYYGRGQNSSGLTTKYSKVRFDPGTLTVNIADTTFSTSIGYKRFGYSTFYTNEYATAGDCIGNGSSTGQGNVDLTGTPFYVLPNQFETGGWNPAGNKTYSSNGQVVNLTGGGYCGFTQPIASPMLKLGMLDNTAPTTQAELPSTSNTAGWYNTDFTVVLTAADQQSGVKTILYSLNGDAYVEVSGSTASVSITANGTHSFRYYAVDNAGNTEQEKSIRVSLDKTAPVISVAGNLDTYTVDQNIYISCSVADVLSGPLSTNCNDIAGPASEFALGNHSYTFTATDNASNVRTSTISFTISVNPESLGNLTQQFITDASVAASLTSKLSAIQASISKDNTNAKSGQVKAFINQIEAKTGKSITNEQAQILIELVKKL